MTGKELYYIAESHFNGRLAGDGPFTQKCHTWIEKQTGCKKALLTHSCTAALEMAALLLDIKPGDEVIMPSFTFVSTANAFVLRGGIPVFVDIREDTLNIDENLIEEAISPRTKAIVPVHYAGVSCEMDSILNIANKYDISVIEDAAQAVMSTYKSRSLGSLGDLGAYSFHETKNVISGEGGCLLVNNDKYSQLAEIIREKGTDRSRFFRGEVDKYTWQEYGSSYLPGELIAAFLWAQLEESRKIVAERLRIWNRYHELLKPLEDKKVLRRQIVPLDCQHNGHMYYILISEEFDRQKILKKLNEFGISAVFHYIPLHSSPAGKKFGVAHGELNQTNKISEQIVRLPLWIGLSEEQQRIVVEQLELVLSN